MWDLIGIVDLDGGEASGQPFHVSVDPRDEWVYVSKRHGRYRMWSGRACSECTVELLSVRRCSIHADLVMVAVQCRLL